MYKLVITDSYRIWYYNGDMILKYFYDSGFSLEDCTLCWYYLSTENVEKCFTTFSFKNEKFNINTHYKSKLDPNVIDNILYTPCNIAIYKYNSGLDNHEAEIARSYYDIYKFFASHSDDSFVDTYDGKRIGKLGICNNIVNNIPVIVTKYWDDDMYNIGLRKSSILPCKIIYEGIINFREKNDTLGGQLLTQVTDKNIEGYSLTCGLSRDD
jgi:hypothetical protein